MHSLVLYNLAKVSVTMVKSYNTTHSVVTFEVDIRQVSAL